MKTRQPKTTTLLALTLLVVLSLALRFFKIESIPAILNRDEAALAYNALLLEKTGTDEWGRSWPLSLESFGDYKLPGYVLTLVGLFKILPKEDWVVRLPSVIAGVALIPLSYFLARNWGYKPRARWFITLSVATTPVFFFYSRMAFEAMLGLSLWILIFSLILFKTTKKSLRIFRDVSVILLTIVACFTYNTPFLLLPFLILLIPLLRGIKNWKQWSALSSGLLLVFISVAFVLIPLTSQKSGITIFSDETTLTEFITFRESLSPALQPILGNKYLYFFGLIIKNFVASFSPMFLVIKGGNHPWHSLPNAGNIAVITYFLGIIGIFSIFTKFYVEIKELFTANQKNKLTKIVNLLEMKQFILIFLLVSSLAPSVITVDAPHTTRSLPFLFWWLFISVEGLIFISNKAQKFISNTQKKSSLKQTITPLVLGISVFILSIEFVIFNYKYFVQYPSNQPIELKVGFDKAIKEAKEKYNNEPIAVVDGDGYLYIVTAWYLQVSPEEYFATIVRQQPNQIGFRYGEQLLNFHFIAHSSDLEKTGEKILLEQHQNTWSSTSL